MELDALTIKITKESLKILILASLLSSIGGFGLEMIREKLLAIIPLLILMPALNDLIGDFGAVISSKFTTMLYMGRLRKKWWKSKKVKQLFTIIVAISLISSVYIGILASVIASFSGYPITLIFATEVVAIAMLSTTLLVIVIFLVSVVGGLYIYKKDMDPDNFLIPITTSIGDLGSMLIFSLVILYFFA